MTSTRDIRLLIADVDGTLVTHDKVLTSKAVAAAGALRHAGIGLALTSARPPAGMRMLIEPLRIETPIAGFNGGLIVDAGLAELESHPIASETARTAVGLLEDSGLDVWTYTDTTWFVSRPGGPHVDREAWIIKMAPTVTRSMSESPDRLFKIVGVSDDRRKMAAAEAAARGELDGAANVSRSAPHYLDITDIAANKGLVARSLARRLGIDAAQIAAIGDMPNDILMFRECGLSIAMGNAADEVKTSADVVTDSNEDEGFAAAVRRYLLARTPIPAEDERAS